MADRLTQLQDCLDQLATQMYASIRYIQTRHAYATIEGQPDLNPFAIADTAQTPGLAPGDGGAPLTSAPLPSAQPDDAGGLVPAANGEAPDTPEAFEAALQELAKDLVVKEQQIEAIIDVLPGIGTSEQAQTRRMRELEAELREVEKERREAAAEKERLQAQLDAVIARIRRY